MVTRHAAGRRSLRRRVPRQELTTECGAGRARARADGNSAARPNALVAWWSPPREKTKCVHELCFCRGPAATGRHDGIHGSNGTAGSGAAGGWRAVILRLAGELPSLQLSRRHSTPKAAPQPGGARDHHPSSSVARVIRAGRCSPLLRHDGFGSALHPCRATRCNSG
jgi:hypothetical protein